MDKFSEEESGASFYLEALRVLGRRWLIIAGMHACVNAFLLSWLGVSWPTENWPRLLWIYSIAIYVFLFLVALSAVAINKSLNQAAGRLRRPKLAIKFLTMAGVSYSIAWVGIVVIVFSRGETPQIISIALSSMLLGLVSVRFSGVLGTMARVFLLVPMLSVIVGLMYRADEWINFIALALILGGVVMLGISLYDAREYISVYRIRRRQARLQTQLRQQNEALAEASSSKSRLLAMASHDLRQPVHALGLLVDRLRCDPGASTVRERVEVIHSVVEELSTTLEKLMALAKFDAGAVPVHLESVALDRMFISLVHEFEPIAVQKGLTFECELGGLLVHTDATLLRTMICNLLANAIRYSHQGTVRSAATLLQDGRTVRVQISDNGVGIPTERIPDIFEAFVRLGVADSGSEGLGLGLVITRRGAELLNIPIHVQSEVGKGTVFSLDLPLSSSQPTPVFPFRSIASNLQGLRVVILDNDPVVLSSMAQTLEEWGCRIISGGGLKGVELKLKAIRGSVDLIITDYHLGAGVTGIDVIQRLRRNCGKNIPAIILTGDVAIRLNGEVDGSRMVVAHKPLSPARLSDLVVKTAALCGPSTV